MKKLFFTLLLLFFFPALYAQEKSDNTSKLRLRSTHRLTLKLPLSSLVGDIYAESMGIGIGVEKKINTGLSFSQEMGYIFHVDRTSILSEDVKSINGFKFTTEIRRYLNKRGIPESGFFVNMELKNILTRSTQESRTSESTLVENEITRYRGVLTANLGVLFYWDQYKKGRITLELMGGGGLGYVNANSSIGLDYPGIKTDYNSAKGFYPWLNLDFKIGYVLK